MDGQPGVRQGWKGRCSVEWPLKGAGWCERWKGCCGCCEGGTAGLKEGRSAATGLLHLVPAFSSGSAPESFRRELSWSAFTFGACSRVGQGGESLECGMN